MDARFCDGCGTAAPPAQPVAAETAAQQARAPSYAPPAHLAARILRDRALLEGERRTVTVLFVDAVRSVEMTASLDPETHHRIVTRSTELMIEAVNRYEGTVTQFRGDGIMAIFGAPIAHEDGARRALASAIAMRDALMRYTAELEEAGGRGFTYRMGLNTGGVIVGRIGNDLSMDYTAVGDTVNLAARMEGLAAVGSIYVTDATRRATADYFEFLDLGVLEIKGKSESLQAFEVARELPARSRFDASVARGLTPYVGREQDLALLRESFELARSGHGQVVFLAGDPGIGKSRLLLEFQRGLGPDVRWLEGHCPSYGRDMPYVPIVEIVRDALQISEGDDEEHVRAHAARVTASWAGRAADAADQFAYLLNPRATVAGDGANPQERSARILDALRGLIAHLNAESPAVIVIEDLHWIDEQSEMALGALVDATASARVLLVLTHRPGYVYPLGDRAFFNRRTLRSLAEHESGDLASRTLAASGMPEELRELVIQRAEGNPFYIEEVVHAVVESGALRREDNGTYTLTQPLADVMIPDTVQGVILSRLDRLSWKARELVQHAAIVGRTFPLRLVEHMLGPGADASPCVDELKGLDLVYERAYFPEPECMFKHALTHEVALSTLLADRRRDMHHAAAVSIETVYADRLHDYVEALAHHYFAAKEWERALHYARLAAERSRRLHAPRAAIEHLSRAIEALERLDRTPDTALLRERALAYEAIGRFDDARVDHEAIMHIARAGEDLRPEWQALVDLGMLWAGRDYARAGEHWRRASELAEMDGDQVMIASSLNRIGNWHVNVEETIEGRAHHERALAIFEEINDADGIAETLDFLSMTLGMSGYTGMAIDVAERAIAIFRAAGNKMALANVLAATGSGAPSVESRTFVPVLLQNSEAESRLSEALALSRELMWRSGESFALMILGAHRAARGRYGEALALLDESRTIAEEIGHHQWESGSNCMTGIFYSDLQQPVRARMHLERGLKLAHDIGSTYWQRSCAAHLAGTWLLQRDLAQAKRVLDAAISADMPALVIGQRELWLTYGLLLAEQERWPDVADIVELLADAPEVDGDITRVPYVAMLAARAAAAMGDRTEAERVLRLALETATAWRVPALLWQVHAALAEVLTEAGRPDEARTYYAAARTSIEEIASGLTGDVRDGFLGSERVRAILDKARGVGAL